MKMNKIMVSMLAAGVIASPLAHATDGYFPTGYGVKNEAMGGASIALPLDAVAAANNPAGMVMVGDRVDFALTWFKPDRSAQITAPSPAAGTYDGNGRSNFFIPDFGYNKMISADTSLGVSVYGNGGMNTQYNTNPFTAFGANGNLGINLEQLFVAPTWAMKINPTNAVGVSLNLAYQMFSATGINGLAFSGMSSSSGNLSDNGTDTSTGYGVRIGWTGEVTPTVTLGATYQSKTSMSKFSNYSGLFADQGSFDIPSNYGLGIAVKATPATTVAFDVVRTNYSDVSSVSNTFPQPLPLGATGGPGFGWQNINTYKLGVSYAYDSTLTLRAGLNHCDQPIPDNQTLLNIVAPAVVQNHLSLGATWILANKSELSVAYVHAFSQTVNGSGSIPGSFGGGDANLTMKEDSIGVSYGW
ncbi:MAG: outer membrane protein transport protein [Gallionella sp.]